MFSSRQCPEQKRQISGGTVDNLSKVQKNAVKWISRIRERASEKLELQAAKGLSLSVSNLALFPINLPLSLLILHTFYFARTARTIVTNDTHFVDAINKKASSRN